MPPQFIEQTKEPSYHQIYCFYRDNILSGDLAHKDKLPSVRALAQHLGTSRNPVEIAYSHLVAEGYVIGKARSGYFVASIEHFQDVDLTSSTDVKDKPDEAPYLIMNNLNASEIIDFSHDSMDFEHFPLTKWKNITQKILQPSDDDLFSYGDRKGEPHLRGLITEYLRQNRGVSCHPRQVIITSGTQQAILILCSLLNKDLRRIAVESAMHPGIYRIFMQQKIEPVPISLHNDGINCEELSQHEALQGVYVTPSHQFPYGMVMPASSRNKLLHWAQRNNAIILEDDYDSEFLFEGRPLPALQGIDKLGRVVYLGTFSKVLAPGIRLSYMVLPPNLVERFECDFTYYDQTASRLTQKTLELFIAKGHLDRHIRRMRRIYREKRDVLISAIQREFEDQAVVAGTSSGLHVILSINSSHSTDTLVRKAAECGVKVYSSSIFEINKDYLTERGPHLSSFVMGFGGLSPKQLEEGIRLLAYQWLSI